MRREQPLSYQRDHNEGEHEIRCDVDDLTERVSPGAELATDEPSYECRRVEQQEQHDKRSDEMHVRYLFSKPLPFLRAHKRLS